MSFQEYSENKSELEKVGLISIRLFYSPFCFYCRKARLTIKSLNAKVANLSSISRESSTSSVAKSTAESEPVNRTIESEMQETSRSSQAAPRAFSRPGRKPVSKAESKKPPSGRKNSRSKSKQSQEAKPVEAKPVEVKPVEAKVNSKRVTRVQTEKAVRSF